ncbi:unnamed protein product [Rotaria socialis]|uniref:Uncharacterized protein n=2 Tax=Rotaria socialis TaxID=392032 RepID=A0A820G3X2_9BILA|nr:unnamed protein product [Rotaria socialis]CAF4363917.1 unnamed protein product [Rotaria socialis]
MLFLVTVQQCWKIKTYPLGIPGKYACTTTTTLIARCQNNEVSWDNRCYYLDGAGGVSEIGYSLGINTVLRCIAPHSVGKNYRSTVSDNCYIWIADTYQCYGMATNCNTRGAFSSGPVANGTKCNNLQNHHSKQLTFCGSIELI